MSETAQVEVTAMAAATRSKDPEGALAAVAALRVLAEVLESLNVQNARAEGWSWESVATWLGVTRQAVHKKYAGRRFPLGGGPGDRPAHRQ